MQTEPNSGKPPTILDTLFRATVDNPNMTTDEVQGWLVRGESPNSEDGEGWTALKQFSRHGNTEGVRLLLAAGADPNIVGRSRLTALHVARNGEIATMLIAAGANVNAGTLETPLHTAIADTYFPGSHLSQTHADIIGTIQALIAGGASVNSLGHETARRTPLDLVERVKDVHLRDRIRKILTAAGGIAGSDLPKAADRHAAQQHLRRNGKSLDRGL